MTKSRDLANAATALNAVTAAELGYVDGVTSAIQTQLDAKIGNVVSANSSGNALEIRQTGAGKALVIEDEANPDSTPFVVAADGKVGIGVSNPTGQPLEIGSGSFGARITRYSATSYAGSGIDLRKSSSGTVGTDAAVASGDRLGRVLYSGYDGTSYVSPTEIGSDVDGTVSTGVVPSRLYFATASTAGTVTERMRVDSAGNVGIGTTSPTAKLDVNGSVKSDNLSGRNAIYNSGFDIAQRGTSFTGLNGDAYTLDRWVPWSTTGGQSNYVSQESVGNLSVTPNQAIRYCLRFGRTSGTTNTGGRQLFQTLETADSVRLAGKTVTFSFYARKGANYSQTDSILQFYVGSGEGTDQKYYSFTNSAAIISVTSVILTTSWQRFTATGTVSTNAKGIAVSFLWSPTGTAGVSDYFEVTGVQLEEGSVATPFSRAGGTIQGELAACQRYYQRFTSPNSTNNAPQTVFGMAQSTTVLRNILPVKTTMRTAPSSIDFSNLQVVDGVSGYTVTNVTFAVTGSADFIDLLFTASGLTQFRGGWVNTSSSAGYLGVSAEL